MVTVSHDTGSSIIYDEKKKKDQLQSLWHQGKVRRASQATKIQSKLHIVLLEMFADSSYQGRNILMEFLCKYNTKSLVLHYHWHNVGMAVYKESLNQSLNTRL